MQGETVSINLAQADAHLGVFVILKNARGNVRVLQPYEQLIIDSIHCNSIDSNGSPGLSNPVDFHAGPGPVEGTTDGNVYVGSIGGQYDSVNGVSQAQGFNRIAFPHEGVTLPLGFNLKVQSAIGLPVFVSGSGRIITSSQPTGRQPYQSTLNP